MQIYDPTPFHQHLLYRVYLWECCLLVGRQLIIIILKKKHSSLMGGSLSLGLSNRTLVET